MFYANGAEGSEKHASLAELAQYAPALAAHTPSAMLAGRHFTEGVKHRLSQAGAHLKSFADYAIDRGAPLIAEHATPQLAPYILRAADPHIAHAVQEATESLKPQILQALDPHVAPVVRETAEALKPHIQQAVDTHVREAAHEAARAAVEKFTTPAGLQDLGNQFTEHVRQAANPFSFLSKKGAYSLYMALQKQAADDNSSEQAQGYRHPYLAGATVGGALGGMTGTTYGLLGREAAGLKAVGGSGERPRALSGASSPYVWSTKPPENETAAAAQLREYRELRAASDRLTFGADYNVKLPQDPHATKYMVLGANADGFPNVRWGNSVEELAEAIQNEYRKHPAHAKFRAAANAHVNSRAGIGAALGLGAGLVASHFATSQKQAADDNNEQTAGGRPWLAGAGGGLAGAAAGYGGTALHQDLQLLGFLKNKPEYGALVSDIRGLGAWHKVTNAPLLERIRAIAAVHRKHPDAVKALLKNRRIGGAVGAAAGITGGLGLNYLLAGHAAPRQQ